MRDDEKDSRKKAKRLRREMPGAEMIRWSWLRKRGARGYRFRRQHPIGPYIADFACVEQKLIVEVDGATHWAPEQKAHDARRTEFLEARGWTIVRVTNPDVYKNLDGVARLILANLPSVESRGV